MRSKCSSWGFEVSHPCAEKMAQGWGTQGWWRNQNREAGPSTALRFAQDDRLFGKGGR
jgi:hypothetical protein